MKKLLLALLFVLVPILSFADTKIFDEQDLLRAHKIGSAPSTVKMQFRGIDDKDLKNCFLVDVDSGNKLSASDVDGGSGRAKFDRVPEGIWKIATVPEGKYTLIKIEVN